ncbi:MAG: hypothetical protein KAX64_02275 [Chromatiaceae bacterium]|nr:hypothetical protein [Chromatiaceae bacterium]
MNWFSQLQDVLKLLPAIIIAIKAIEEAIPGQGKGEQKLAAIRAIMEAANGQIGIIWPLIETTIGILVGLFNKTGTFSTGK